MNIYRYLYTHYTQHRIRIKNKIIVYVYDVVMYFLNITYIIQNIENWKKNK